MSFLDSIGSTLGSIFKPIGSILGGLAPAAGTLLGGAFGGPMGAGLGGSLGSMVGNLFGGGGGGSQPAAAPAQLPAPQQQQQMPQYGQPQQNPMYGAAQQFGSQLNSYLPQQMQGVPMNQMGNTMGQMAGNYFGLPGGVGSMIGNVMQGGINRFMPQQYQSMNPQQIGESFGRRLGGMAPQGDYSGMGSDSYGQGSQMSNHSMMGSRMGDSMGMSRSFGSGSGSFQAPRQYGSRPASPRSGITFPGNESMSGSRRTGGGRRPSYDPVEYEPRGGMSMSRMRDSYDDSPNFDGDNFYASGGPVQMANMMPHLAQMANGGY